MLATILLVFYIGMEMAFRSQLIDYISSITNYFDVYFIEFSGRFISSIGFAILVNQFVGDFRAGKKIIIAICSFILFFWVEKVAINYITSIMSNDVKVKAALLVNYRESILLRLKSTKEINLDQASQYDKVRVSFLAISNINNIDLINSLFQTKRKDFELVYFKKALKNIDIEQEQFPQQLSSLIDLWSDISYKTKPLSVALEKNKRKILNSQAFISKRLKEYYNNQSFHKSLKDLLSSNDGREFVISGRFIGLFLFITQNEFPHLPPSIEYCVIRKPWMANDLKGMIKYIHICTGEEIMKIVNSRFKGENIIINSKDVPEVITRQKFDQFFTQPYFYEVTEYVAPFVARENGKIYPFDKLAPLTIIHKKHPILAKELSINLAKKQAHEISNLLDNPELAMSNERYNFILDSYLKSMLVPPIMIVISTLMILLNIIKLVGGVITISFEQKNNVKYITNSLIFGAMCCIMLFLPSFISSDNKITFLYEKQTTKIIRSWTEDVSLLMSVINHKTPIFKECLGMITYIDGLSQKLDVPILSSGLYNNNSYRRLLRMRLEEYIIE